MVPARSRTRPPTGPGRTREERADLPIRKPQATEIGARTPRASPIPEDGSPIPRPARRVATFGGPEASDGGLCAWRRSRVLDGNPDACAMGARDRTKETGE
jgi:hypothetical protein